MSKKVPKIEEGQNIYVGNDGQAEARYGVPAVVKEPSAFVSSDAPAMAPLGGVLDYSMFHGIFGNVSPEEIALATSVKSKTPQGFSPAIMALVSSVFGGYGLDPAFIAGLEAAAQKEGLSLADYLAGKKATDAGRAEIFKIFEENSLLVKNFSGLTLNKGQVVFWDDGGNTYIESGDGVKVKLAGAKKTKDVVIPAERFGPAHANKIMALFIAGRFDGTPREIDCVISKSGIGRKSEIETMMILAALQQSKNAGVVPNLYVKKGLRGKVVSLENLDFSNLDAKGLLAMGLNENTATELLDAYNNRKGAVAAVASVSVEGLPATDPVLVKNGEATPKSEPKGFGFKRKKEQTKPDKYAEHMKRQEQNSNQP
jgi:hypothetical protein